MQGLDVFRAAAAEGPLLVVCNHSAWWDSLLAIALVTGELKLDGYALMEARNLRRFPFLGRVGGFGIERGVPDDGARAITYGGALLDRPGRVVWVFPEGREMPFHRRPLVFKRGAAAMLEQAASPAARCVPVSVAYVFGAEERPTVWMTFGAPQTRTVSADPDEAAARQASSVEAGLARIAEAVAARVDTGQAPADFPVVIAGTHSRLGALATALLARMTRFKALDG